MFLINLDDQPCDTSVDWCGWKNDRGWKRIRYQEHHQDYQNESGVKDIDGGGNHLITLSQLDHSIKCIAP